MRLLAAVLAVVLTAWAAAAQEDRQLAAQQALAEGQALMERYEFEQALDALQRALELQRAVGDLRAQAGTLKLMGTAHDTLGDTQRRLEIARQIVETHRRIGDRGGMADALNELASAHINTGALQEGLDLFREVLAIVRELGDRDGEASALGNIGSVHEELGDGASAVAAFEQALAIRRGLGSGHEVGVALLTNNLAGAYSTQGHSAKAIEIYREALARASELGQSRRAMRRTVVLNNLGYELNVIGTYAEARAALEEALRLSLEVGHTGMEAAVRVNLGAACAGLGQGQEARTHYERSLALARARGDRSRESKALERLTLLASDAGELERARELAEATIATLEAMRRNLTSSRLRSSLAASVRRAYELQVDVLMGLHRRHPAAGHDAEALRSAELGRARVLLDSLGEAQARIREGVDTALLEQERALRERLSAAVDRQMRLATGGGAPERAQSAAADVQALSSEWDAVKARLMATSPRYAALKDPEPLSAREIQQRVLDGDTVLLEYALGAKRSFLWVVAAGALATYELPPRAEVERAARAAYESVVRPSAEPSRDALRALSRMILAPAADQLKDRRLLIVPDGALHYVPFGALPDPAGAGRPLLTRHEIVSAPSASVFALLRLEQGSRPRPPRTLAVLADPVYERGDARVQGTATASLPAEEPPDEVLQRALRSATTGSGLPRLPFTRREADAILALVPPAQRKAAFDFDASRSAAMDPSLSEFRLVHFATHGFLNSAHPELSGIVLSLLDRAGQPARGFLTAADVFNLRLNADVVVLSGCQTALGQDLRGEGLVGLSRAFMYAGTPRVVASLWRVDDAATAELMKGFYRAVLKDGLPPAAALRAAQLALMRRARFQDPFYWAAFQLQGEWR